MIPFEKLKFTDGQIYGLTLQDDILIVNFKDWNNFQFGILFTDLKGFEVLGSLNEDLSHTEVVVDSKGYSCFSFISSWNKSSLINVTAKKVTVFGI